MALNKKGIAAGVVGISVLAAVFSPDKTVESIELSIPNYQDEYDINTEIPIEISVLPKDSNTSSLKYIVEGNSFDFSESGIVTGNEEGRYELYITSGDITSNTVYVNVVDISAREVAAAKEAKEAEEKRLADEKAAQEAEEKKLAEEKAAKEAEEKKLAEEKAAKEAEEKKLAEESAAKEAEAQKLAEEQASNEVKTQVSSPVQISQESSSSNSAASTGGDSNFNTYDNASQQQTEATYVLNTSTKKIHHPSCSSVKKIAPKNYSTSNSSVDELISQGYSTCGNCFK